MGNAGVAPTALRLGFHLWRDAGSKEGVVMRSLLGRETFANKEGI
jgi:hypothetical protein